MDKWGVAAEILSPTPHLYVDDTNRWINDALGEFLWSKQRRVVELVEKHRYVAVQSCHDAGKSFIASRVLLKHLSVHGVGDAFAVSTAPTNSQVKAILWREIARGHQKLVDRLEQEIIDYTVAGSLPGRITLDAQMYAGTTKRELVAYGRKPADYDPSGFVGIHSLYPLIIIDEAGGIPKSLFDAVDSLATNANARVLAIGNPDDPQSHFATICKPGSGWVVEKISAFDTPAFTGEPVPEELLPLLVSREWVEERKKRWGEQSPVYQSKVLGEFPQISDNMVFTPHMITEAQNRDLSDQKTGKPVLGVDIARYGEDESVIVRRESGYVRVVAAASKNSTLETTGLIKKVYLDICNDPITKTKPTIYLDSVGVGAGVYDNLVEAGYPIIGVLGSDRAIEHDQYANSRAERFWTLRKAFEDGEIDIDPLDDELANQLLSIKFKYDSRGRILIESKDEMKKRGISSPDRADALSYAWSAQSAATIDIKSHTYGKIVMDDIMSVSW